MDTKRIYRNLIKKGIVTRMDPLEYPVLINVKNFPNWNKAKFASDNDLITAPPKNTVRKLIRETLVNLTLNNMLLDGDLGSNPTVESVTSGMRIAADDIGRMINRHDSREKKDRALCRAYIAALEDAGKRVSSIAKLLKKNPGYLVRPSTQTSKKKAPSKSRKKPKKRTSSSQRKSPKKSPSKVSYRRKRMKNGRYAHYKVDRKGKMKRISKELYSKRKK